MNRSVRIGLLAAAGLGLLYAVVVGGVGGPGGHHRTGTLSFAEPVPPGAAVELRIAGLPEDAIGIWTAP